MNIQYELCKTHFYQAIAHGPSYVCTSCHQTWFQHSLQQVQSLKLKKEALPVLHKCSTNYIPVEQHEWICRTCIRKGQFPRISVANKVFFPNTPQELYLHELEERLWSPLIPFMQIRELPSGRQFSVKGSVVNVPLDVAPIVTALPRQTTACHTIPVKLKKPLSFISAVYTQNVRPKTVIDALAWLMKNGPVFSQLQIVFNESWFEQYNEKINESDNANCPERSTSDISDMHSNDDNDSDQFSEIDETDRSANVETMLCEAEYDSSQVMSFAPGEDQTPISLYYDNNADYLAFPTIFCVHRRLHNSERSRPVHYSDLCKSELGCIDRRVANCVPNIFFKFKKVQMQQVSNKVMLALRRCKTSKKKDKNSQQRYCE